MQTEHGAAREPTRIGGYDLLAKLGAGGAGTVYKAVHRISGAITAIKVMPAELAANPVLRKRFEEEFRAARLLDHPNIVRALDYHDGEQPFLVMEFVDGESLGEILATNGRLPEPEALALIFQMCNALAQAHRQGIIHRDVKPDNILVQPDGVAKLADLGLVKRVETESNLTRTGRGLGTPHFMAPEQFRNARGVDARCDVYSLGATLYMMLTGKLPFQGRGPLETWTMKMKGDLLPARRVVQGVSAHVEAAIQRAVSPNPAHRQESCEQLVAELRGAPPPPVVLSGAVPVRRWLVVYRDAKGNEQRFTASSDEVRQALASGRCGDPLDVRIGRGPDGELNPLEAIPEFCDLLTHLVNAREAGAQGSHWMTTITLLVLAAGAAVMVGHLLFGLR